MSPSGMRLMIIRQRQRDRVARGEYGAQVARAQALAARRLRAAEHGYSGPLTRQEVAVAGARPVTT